MTAAAPPAPHGRRRRRPPLAPRLPFRQDQWRRFAEWPVSASALLFLVAYSWSVIGDLRGVAADAAEWVMWGVWVVFLVDYVVMLVLAEARMRWFRGHLLEFLVVALPVLRPLRLLRLLSLWRVLHRAAGVFSRGRVTAYVLASGLLLVYIASLAELEAERHAPHSEITTFGDAVWWAFETITTVGYGDRTPRTLEGRCIAVGLMVAGIALLGVVTATLASWMVDRVHAVDEGQAAATKAQIELLHEEVRALTALVRQQQSDRASS